MQFDGETNIFVNDCTSVSIYWLFSFQTYPILFYHIFLYCAVYSEIGKNLFYDWIYSIFGA